MQTSIWMTGRVMNCSDVTAAEVDEEVTEGSAGVLR